MFEYSLFYSILIPCIAIVFQIVFTFFYIKAQKNKIERKEKEEINEEENKETKPKITIPPELSEIKILIEHTKKKKALIDTKAQEIQHLLTYLLKKNQFLIESKKNNLDLEEHEIDTSLIDFLE